MIQFLSVDDAIDLHAKAFGGGKVPPLRDLKLLESAIYSAQATFEGEELHADLWDKAAALCFSLNMNQAFLDGNKRAAQICMEAFLIRNGYELYVNDEEQASVMMDVANRKISKDQLALWIRDRLISKIL